MKALYNFVGLIALALMTAGAHAQQCATLVYTGAPFNSLVTTGPNSQQIEPLTGTVVLTAPLAANLVAQPVTPVSWNFAGEEKNLTSTLNDAGGQFTSFAFSTDASGNITSWTMHLWDGTANDSLDGWSMVVTSTPAGDNVAYGDANLYVQNGSMSITGTNATAGAWSCPPPPTVNPLAAPLAAAQSQIAVMAAQASAAAAQIAALTAQVSSLKTQLAAVKSAPSPAPVVTTPAAATPVMVAGTSSGGGALSWLALLGLAAVAKRRVASL